MIKWVDSIASTNTAIAADPLAAHGDVLATVEQTAGRGQRGNSWEATPGKNLTFSMVLRPRVIPPAEAFAISMLTCMSVADVIAQAMNRHDVLIKWPNDIYVNNDKICGILIENSFGSHIHRSIIGVGINVNQETFVSDAPNPISMWQLTGRRYDLHALLEQITARMLADFDRYEAAPDIGTLTTRYRSRQWRGSGVYSWRDNLTGEVIDAAIADIAPDGTLTLDTTPPRRYAFKEISPIIVKN